jgi:hypothetical protein
MKTSLIETMMRMMMKKRVAWLTLEAVQADQLDRMWKIELMVVMEILIIFDAECCPVNP